jgi:WD40 repeat protein
LIFDTKAGHQPRILIYDIENTKLEMALTGHKYGILTSQFSLDGQLLVSVGFHHDGYIYVWDWKTGKRLAGCKVLAPIFSLAIDPLSKYFVTCGDKHLKVWDLSPLSNPSSLDNGKVFMLEGKLGILGERKGEIFVDVGCAVSKSNPQLSYIYGLTLTGYLVMFNEAGILEKWLHAKMEKGSCLHVTKDNLMCGGSDGKIRCFELENLKHIYNLPTPDPLLATFPPSKLEDELPRAYPQVVAMKSSYNHLVVVYSNLNLCVFDISDRKKVEELRNIKFHADCIWGVMPFTTILNSKEKKETDGFITYSSDGSVRFWDCQSLTSPTYRHQTPLFFTTLLADSKGALKFKYFDRKLSRGLILGFGSSNDIKSVTERTGIRSVAIDPSNRLIACGDRNGTIGVFTFDTFEKVASIEAHDAEIMALDFAALGLHKYAHFR